MRVQLYSSNALDKNIQTIRMLLVYLFFENSRRAGSPIGGYNRYVGHPIDRQKCVSEKYASNQRIRRDGPSSFVGHTLDLNIQTLTMRDDLCCICICRSKCTSSLCINVNLFENRIARLLLHESLVVLNAKRDDDVKDGKCAAERLVWRRNEHRASGR